MSNKVVSNTVPLSSNVRKLQATKELVSFNHCIWSIKIWINIKLLGFAPKLTYFAFFWTKKKKKKDPLYFDPITINSTNFSIVTFWFPNP